jgi:hypothetical protein
MAGKKKTKYMAKGGKTTKYMAKGGAAKKTTKGMAKGGKTTKGMARGGMSGMSGMNARDTDMMARGMRMMAKGGPVTAAQRKSLPPKLVKILEEKSGNKKA